MVKTSNEISRRFAISRHRISLQPVPVINVNGQAKQAKPPIKSEFSIRARLQYQKLINQMGLQINSYIVDQYFNESQKRISTAAKQDKVLNGWNVYTLLHNFTKLYFSLSRVDTSENVYNFSIFEAALSLLNIWHFSKLVRTRQRFFLFSKHL